MGGRLISRVVRYSRDQGIVGPDVWRVVVQILQGKERAGEVENEKHKTVVDRHSYEDDKLSIVFLRFEEKKKSFGEGLGELGAVLPQKALLKRAVVVEKKKAHLCEEGTDRTKAGRSEM